MTFDKWWNNYDNLQCDKDSCEDAYVSGQESKQCEINELVNRLKQLLNICKIQSDFGVYNDLDKGWVDDIEQLLKDTGND